jgi:hypothetical protein
MKLSEAIALGSTFVKPQAFGRTKCDPPEVGCALEMALAAIGAKGNWRDSWLEWPWLSQQAWGRGGITYRNLITNTFDLEVMSGKKSLEDPITYVKSVEPVIDNNKFRDTTQSTSEKEQQECHSIVTK